MSPGQRLHAPPPPPRRRSAESATETDGEGSSSRPRSRSAVPALVARPGGPAERLARALPDHHPALVFLIALLSGFLLLAAASILLGLLVVHVLASGSGLGLAGADESVNETLARHRDGTLTTLSEIGSQVGGAPVLPILVGLIGIACALVVPRHRPTVHRLESLPVSASYPSGHTAASVAVYSGLVLLLTSRFTTSLSKALAWTCAILLTTFVALSRMYRGMHHPLDVAGGVLVGVGAILLLLLACRAAGAAAERRVQR
jgi:membrane-associated phospholipid phosphatase